MGNLRFIIPRSQTFGLFVFMTAGLLSVSGCAVLPAIQSVLPAFQKDNPVIQIEKEAGANPWTDLEFADSYNDFQFAVVSDNTGGAYPGVFDTAMMKLNLVQPEFVMSVGDFIEGYSNNETALTQEWEDIEASVDKLEMPFFYVVGNHDMGDPASQVVWKERHGRTYYYFIYKDVLFLCMNTEDPPQGIPGWLLKGLAKVSQLEDSDPKQADVLRGEILGKVKEAFKTGERYSAAFSDEQVTYFEEAIADHPEVRWTFLFVHRPVWQSSLPDEKFKQIEMALQGRPYTVFAGHAHTYDYQQQHDMDYIRLSTTGGAWVLDPPGNFDHIAWVTMTDDGPVVANVTLDGIFDKTGERKPVRDKMQ